MPKPVDTPPVRLDAARTPPEYNPFDGVEALPGLGIAVLWVVLAFVVVNLLMLPVQP